MDSLLTPDDILIRILDDHKERLDAAGLASSAFPFVIFVTEETAQHAVAAGRWIRLDADYTELAKEAWRDREDPHGWSPTRERTVAVIVPRV
jgi:hypothetical protein